MTSSDNRHRLFVDLETYSSNSIDNGVYKYVEAEDFQILLLAYAYDDEPVQVIDVALAERLAAEDYPDFPAEVAEWARVMGDLTDPDVVKIAHNCAFERTCLGRHFSSHLPPEEWEDTMALAAYNGLPLSLDACGSALELRDQKIKEGASLISYFCGPCKPTRANGGRTRNLPEHAPDKWARFSGYCRRDVEVEREIYRRLHNFPAPAWENRVRCLDARINERGIQIDRSLVDAAIAMDEALHDKHMARLKLLTGLDNPGSVQQLVGWLSGHGVSVGSLDKTSIADLLGTVTDPQIRGVLRLRQLLGKASTKKYLSMREASCSDDRVRGTLQYYGGRTGRWSGRIVQPQNLPQNHIDPLDAAREIVRSKDLDALGLLYDNPSDVLSQLIRTALVAGDGNTLLVADYAAIEARVIAYLAGCTWRSEVFANGCDIYCASASRMFGVPVEKHGVNAHLRQKGKIAELALGYGGGVHALEAFGADKMGLTATEMQDIVSQWRAASPEIPKLWRDVENAARRVLSGERWSAGTHGVIYQKDNGALLCKLPSGRCLSYWGAQLTDDGIRFMGQNQTTRKWELTSTWGGKLAENIVQAYARDCLATALLRLDEAGYNIIFHVHDEIICEAPIGSRWEDMAEIMSLPIDWAPGLRLRADGYETPYYKKD